jgi:hypothetical protein
VLSSTLNNFITTSHIFLLALDLHVDLPMPSGKRKRQIIESDDENVPEEHPSKSPTPAIDKNMSREQLYKVRDRTI